MRLFILRRISFRYVILIILIVMVLMHLELELLSEKHHQSSVGTIPIRAQHYGRNTAAEYEIFDNKLICSLDSQDAYVYGSALHQNSTTETLNPHYMFDMESVTDVMVFLHIQKTGGTTFGQHLVHNLDVAEPRICHEGHKKCECHNSHGLVWIVSRYSTGWRCGLHADWTELTSGVDDMLYKVEEKHRQRRYLYLTILRDPITRYLSEFKHVQRGATWKAARLQCDGRQASLQEVPFCFEGYDWSGVTFDEFTSCLHNLANNRQTRMLANLSLVDCYSHDGISEDEKDLVLLKSAKENLKNLAFFGLTEYQQETQYMFERTFGLHFKNNFFQFNHTHSSEIILSNQQKTDLLKMNKLDIELYQYAKDLFLIRLRERHKMDNTLKIVQKNTGQYVNPKRNSEISETYEEYEEGDESDLDDSDRRNIITE